MESDYKNTSKGELENYDLVCLSHLRWDFVYQRPQHLMSRFADQRRVFFVEEPMMTDDETHLSVSERETNLFVVVPHLNRAAGENRSIETLMRASLDELFTQSAIENFVLWYYTPMAYAFSRHLNPQAVVYDCMDELSAFKFAPPELIENEAALFARADVVFTGGQSLYEAKRSRHQNVHAMPSSIDKAHFKRARIAAESPADQALIPSPRLGYVGVIDERIDLELIDEIAAERPEWQIVMIGPVVKISEAELPRRANIHYLGMKSYDELPAYIGGWTVALMPFAINDSTKFISPTKTPEYLAAGKPVVSTAIRDVVKPYGERGLVVIADTSDEFIRAAEKLMNEDRAEQLKAADEFLEGISWDATWRKMADLIAAAVASSQPQAAHSGA